MSHRLQRRNEMTLTTQQQITKRLARLREWRDMGITPEADVEETVAAHKEINRLLDKLERENKPKVLR